MCVAHPGRVCQLLFFVRTILWTTKGTRSPIGVADKRVNGTSQLDFYEYHWYPIALLAVSYSALSHQAPLI